MNYVEKLPEAPTAVPGRHRSHRETDDAYPTIVVVTNRVRVINCKDDLQWVVQKAHGDKWEGVSFCRTREVLVRDVQRELSPGWPLLPIPPEALAVLMALPIHHDGHAAEPRCKTCGRMLGKPRDGEVRHLYCKARGQHP